MAAVGAHLLVGGSPVRAVGIAGLGAEHPRKLIEELLHAPEAASGKIDGTHSFSSPFRLRRNPRRLPSPAPSGP